MQRRHVLQYTYVAGALLLSAVSAAGETQPERLARLQSDEFARQSQDALMRGDRPAAIVAALRGLPHKPSDAEILVYSKAWFALFHAVMARRFAMDWTGMLNVAVSPDGERMVIGSDEFDQGGNAPILPFALYDAHFGRKLTDLAPPSVTHHEGWTRAPTPFSPDGSLFALVGYRDPRVFLYDSASGAARGILQGLPTSQRFGVPTDLGFSPDGRLFAASQDGTLLVWDVATGAVVAQTTFPVGLEAWFWPKGWSQDGRITGIYTTNSRDKSKMTIHLAVLDSSGIRLLKDLREIPGTIENDGAIRLLPSRESPYIMMIFIDGLIRIFDLNGSLVSSFADVDGAAAWVRNGTAVAVFSPYTDEGLVRVYGLDGQPLSPVPSDALVFLHGVSSLAGQPVGTTAFAREASTFTASGMEQGASFYDAVWQQLPPDVQSSIVTERVLRP